MTAQSTTTCSGKRGWVRSGAAGLSLLLGCVGITLAQDGGDAHWFDGLSATPQGSYERQPGTITLSGFELVEIAPTGPNQRPRRGLRIRWEGATEAMRSMGLDATDCGTLLRSTGKRRSLADGSAGSYRPGLAIALSCRF